MQQRSAEFTTLFDGFATLRPALLEPMPVAEGRARNVAAADLLAEAEDPAANVGTATKPVTAVGAMRNTWPRSSRVKSPRARLPERPSESVQQASRPVNR